MTEVKSVIRPASSGDKVVLMAHWRAMCQAMRSYGYDIEPTPENGNWWMEHRLPAGQAFVADLDGRVIGFSFVSIVQHPCLSKRVAHLEALYVRPERRRIGVGKRLVQTAIDWAKRAGAKEVVLEHAEENHAAARLYWSLNFQPRSIMMKLEV